jgi:pimeloyl-ACP methyl ester carboxylesterase
VTTPDITTHHFTARDGVRLAWHELGAGRPLLLIHGLFSNARTNWVRYGHAQRFAEGGFRVLMADLRAHGDSAAPHDPDCYPRDVNALDARDLITHLGLTDFDLGGYSLGGRTVLRLLAKGVAPRRAIVAGMGLAGVLDVQRRAAIFRQIIENIGHNERGTPAWTAETFMKAGNGDPAALIPLLHSFIDTDAAVLRDIMTETLVLCGEDDDDNGSAQALAEAMGHARYASMPGNHMSAVAKPELSMNMLAFLRA